MASLIMSSKVWDDLSMWNADFSQVSPSFTLRRINELELVRSSMSECAFCLYLNHNAHLVHSFVFQRLSLIFFSTTLKFRLVCFYYLIFKGFLTLKPALWPGKRLRQVLFSLAVILREAWIGRRPQGLESP